VRTRWQQFSNRLSKLLCDVLMQKRAVKAVTASKAHGIGFVLTGTDIAAIDIDKCRNPATGATDDRAQALKYRRGD